MVEIKDIFHSSGKDPERKILLKNPTNRSSTTGFENLMNSFGFMSSPACLLFLRALILSSTSIFVNSKSNKLIFLLFRSSFCKFSVSDCLFNSSEK